MAAAKTAGYSYFTRAAGRRVGLLLAIGWGGRFSSLLNRGMLQEMLTSCAAELAQVQVARVSQIGLWQQRLLKRFVGG